MTTDFAWIDEYYNWLRGNASAKQLQNGWTEIGTPFMDRHNDGLVIYAKLENDSITLSDDGYIFWIHFIPPHYYILTSGEGFFQLELNPLFSLR